MSKKARKAHQAQNKLRLLVHPSYRGDDWGIEALKKRAPEVHIDLRMISDLYAYVLPVGFEGHPADAAIKLFFP